MKIKFLNGKLSYFFTPRIHSNVLAWVKPAFESERSKHVIENILRWEDDGGPGSENINPPPHVAERNIPQRIGVVERTVVAEGRGLDHTSEVR